MTSGSAACLACGHSRLIDLRPYRAESKTGRNLFRGSVAACEKCELVQLAPAPEDGELSRYYATEYRRGGRYGAAAADLTEFPRDNLFFFNRGESVAELLMPHLGGHPNPRILDVGAGYGHILHSLGARVAGAQLHAHELSEPCVAHLERIGVRVFSGDVVLAIRDEPPFDLVILSHVVEHLRDPVGTLRALRDQLVPDGLLFVEVPHVPRDRITAFDDSPWAPRHDEPHLTFFGVARLRALLESAGFAVRFAETAGPAWHAVSRLRYRLPALMPTVRRYVPRRLLKLAGRPTAALGPWPDFRAYGGHRIWIRSVSQVSRD